MTHITPLTARRLTFSSRIPATILAGLVVIVLQSSSVQAQWAPSGNNISNTNTGNVGIGTTAPDSLITVNANTSGLQAPGANFPGTIFHLSGADNAKARLLFDAFGFGIIPQLTYRYARGTAAAPSAVQLGDTLGQITASGYKATGYTNGSRATISFVATENWTDNANGTAITFFTNPNGLAGPLERLRIDHSGNLGVGTTNPVFDANVARYLTLDGGPSVIGSIGAAGGTTNTGTAVGQMAFINSSLAATDKRLTTIVGSTEGATNSGVLDFYTASAGAFSLPRMRINSSGNIGIGTYTPAYRLDVQGGAINASGGLCIAGDCKTAWSQVGGGGTSQWTTAGSNIFYNTGSVGIGTGSPDANAKVHVFNAPSAGMDIQSANSGSWSRLRLITGTHSYGWFTGDSTSPDAANKIGLYDYTVGAWRMMIDSSGNVGIGTTAPTAQLHIAGANGPANNTGTPAPEAFRIVGGVGGNGSWGGGPGGVGGGLNLIGGTGGTPVAGSQAAFGGNGGSISLIGGNGGPNIFNVGGGVGGDISINGGAGVANSDGNVILANLRGKVGIGSATPGYRLDVQGGQINASGGLCMAGVCKSNWTEAGGSQWTTSGSNLFYNSGNVGIGTTSPGEFVHIRKDQNAPTHLVVENSTAGTLAYADVQMKNNLGHFAQMGIYSSTTTTAGALASGNAFAYTSSPAMVVMANNSSGVIKFATGGVNERARIDASGNLGIGTPTPSEKLEVAGNLKLTGTGNIDAAGTITGGTINAKYQDVAEWVQSSQALVAGTVVVLDHTKSNQVIASSQAYDTRVAGVVSLQPGISLGEQGAGKVLVATTGRVKVKVDASAGPIQVGDLLVTSDIEGVAKKSEPLSLGGVQIHRPGTLIGKALEPLSTGTGEILVLLSLQ